MGLIAELGDGPVGVDTAVFIYFIEASPGWAPIVTPLFAAADAGKLELVTSAVTLLELLVVPYRAGKPMLATRYQTLLTRSRGIRLVDITRDHLRVAAQLRAVAGVRTPDALQLTAARAAGGAVFVTNGRRLLALTGMRIIQLGDYGCA